MFRTVGPLLLGLGLCAAAGCASVGTGRGFNLADRTGNRRADRSETTESKSKEIVSFRPPTSKIVTAATDDANFTGHSSELAQAGVASKSSSVVSAAYEVEPVAEDKPAVTDAHFRSDRDGSDNYVKLQGLQVIETVESDARQTGRDQRLPADADWSTTASATDAAGMVQPINAETDAPAAGPWQAELERLIARAERELSQLPHGADAASKAEYRRRQVHLRLLYLMAQHPEQALIAIPSLDPADTEYWQEMVWAISNSLDPDEQISARDRAGQAIPRVNTALRRLREQADLTIRNAAFCEEISYFGNYKKFPREEFVPGQPVLLYAEIENFRSEPGPTGEYRTLLRSLVEIIGTNGQIRWKKSFAATEDLCRNPRRDYFHNYQFTIPERLPLGPHTLRLTVVDELSGKQSTAQLRFMVK